MLDNLYVLKDGLPIYINSRTEESDDNPSNSKLTDDNQVTMMSGFFSAINSFATTIGNFGQMKEIKMNKIKFSFYLPENYEDKNLLFVGTSEAQTNQKAMELVLSRISSEFIRDFPSVVNGKWNGKTDIFDKFDRKINATIDKLSLDLKKKQQRSEVQKPINATISQNQTNRISNTLISNKIRSENMMDSNKRQLMFQKAKTRSYVPYSRDLFYKLVPIRRIEQDKGIYDIFSGEDSKRVFRQIDGNSSVESISQLTGIRKDRVFHLCKTFIKMGLVNFTK